MNARDLVVLGHWQGDNALESRFVAHPAWSAAACAAMLRYWQ